MSCGGADSWAWSAAGSAASSASTWARSRGREPRRARSLRPRPGLRFAERQHAALDLERGRARQRDAAAIGLAVVGVVDVPRPRVGRAVRLHVEDDLDTHERTGAEGLVDVVLVGD